TTAVVLWVGLLACWCLRTSVRNYIVRRYRQPRHVLESDRRARRWTSSLFFTSLFLTGVTLGSCPHAGYLTIWGTCGVAYSEFNGPCYHWASWSAHVVGRFYVFVT